jgi:hypothetical protein
MDVSVWYLRKASDGSVFGPLTFQQLQQWAADAQVSPMDRVSSDQNNWMKAPMLPELQMDYIVEVGDEQYYGPTTLGALAEFVGAGEINGETSVTNCKDGSQMRVRDVLPPALLHPAPAPDVAISARPMPRRSVSISASRASPHQRGRSSGQVWPVRGAR